MSEKLTDTDRLLKALAAFEGDDGSLGAQIELSREKQPNIRESWKRKTWEENGGGIFETPSGLFFLELEKDGTTKRLYRLDDK